MNMKCEVIMDLLPLYVENIASIPSRELVEEHVAGCHVCRAALDETKGDKLAAVDSGSDTLYKLKKSISRRKWLTVLSALFLTLTVIMGFLSYCLVPINLTYDEAIADVRIDSDMMWITTTDKVTGGGTFNNYILYTGYRCRWIYDMTNEGNDDDGLKGYGIQEDLWYDGSLANDEDVLLYDKEGEERFQDEFYVTSHTMEYLCYGALVLGVIFAGIAFALRQRRAGIVLLSIAVFFLLLGISCLFVTGGRMLYIYNTFPPKSIRLRFNLGTFGIKYFAIALITLFSWSTFMSVFGLVRQLRKK